MKQLRIATLGDWNNYLSYFLVGSMEGAIRCGTWFRPIQLLGVDLSVVKKQIDFFKPHIILSHCIFNTKPEGWREKIFQLLRDAKKKWGSYNCYHIGDARKEPRYPYDISDFMDLGLVNNLEYERWGKIWNIQCINWPYPVLYQKGISSVDERFKSDIVFTGALGSNTHHIERTIFIQQLKDKGINIKTYPDETYGNSRFLTAEISASAKAVLGSQMGKEVFGYVDVRPFQYIGSGALYMQEKHKNIEQFFRSGEHYISFEEGNVDSFLEEYNKYNNKSKKIRKYGFTYCQNYHSTEERIRNIINMYEGKDWIYGTSIRDIEYDDITL